MTKEERENSLHCLKVMVEEANCEDCNLYGTTGTDHCERDCVRNAIEALEQEPCEDCISRQAVIELVNSDWKYEGLEMDVASLPSVNPQKIGHWITQWNVAHQKEYYYCSECREEFSYDGETGIKMNDYNFCPNCGAKMVDPPESEV